MGSACSSASELDGSISLMMTEARFHGLGGSPIQERRDILPWSMAYDLDVFELLTGPGRVLNPDMATSARNSLSLGDLPTIAAISATDSLYRPFRQTITEPPRRIEPAPADLIAEAISKLNPRVAPPRRSKRRGKETPPVPRTLGRRRQPEPSKIPPSFRGEVESVSTPWGVTGLAQVDVAAILA